LNESLPVEQHLRSLRLNLHKSKLVHGIDLSPQPTKKKKERRAS